MKNKMPNDCWSQITITCQDNIYIKKFIEEELKDKEQHINWIKKGKNGIKFDLWSPWIPYFDWFENILEEYPYFWIKNEWKEEGGQAGIWIGFYENLKKTIKKMEWRDLSLEESYYLFVNE